MHSGHMALFETALQHTERLDVYISHKRQRPHDLPHAIRKEAVRTAIQDAEWAKRVELLANEQVPEGLFGIRAELYDLLAVGSDIAGHLVSPTRKWQPRESEFMYSFPRLLVVQREESILSETAAQTLRTRYRQLIVEAPKSPCSASVIRSSYRAGQDISQHVPPHVWDLIVPHVACFEQEEVSTSTLFRHVPSTDADRPADRRDAVWG